jgi:hypothetical protein
MASWIVHLRIAEVLTSILNGLDPAYFAVGNIAPDSGRPDEKWETFDPPYSITHFCEDSLFSDSRDLEFHKKYVMGVILKTDWKRSSFLWGYYCHLLTDNLWNDIRKSTYEKYRQQYEENKEFVWEVKQDWYGLDFCYLRDHPDNFIWKKFLKVKFEGDYLDFLSESAIQEKVEYISGYYREVDDKIRAMMERPFIYLSKDRMDRFVVQSSRFIASRIANLDNNPWGY